MPDQHAILSASSAQKWLNCTRSARLEETLPDTAGIEAKTGTLAHSLAELKLKKKFTVMKPSGYTKKMKEIKANPLYDEEMQQHTDTYLDYIIELTMAYPSTPVVNIEEQVSLTEYVPEGFGTCDCIVLGGDVLQIVDFKYGKGVPVKAENNPQMKLYALGALSLYQLIYRPERVILHIAQPRINNVSSWEISREELLGWGEQEVKPKAEAAFAGTGEFCPGPWCDKGFCKARATCRARSGSYLELKDQYGGALPPTLTDKEVGEVLEKARNLSNWCGMLESYALGALLEGKEIPGWKAVEGRSVREFTDTDLAMRRIVESGFERDMLFKRAMLPLTEIEKLLGKKKFEELCKDYVRKKPGKPTLVSIDDKRAPYQRTGAQEDFAGIQ